MDEAHDQRESQGVGRNECYVVHLMPFHPLESRLSLAIRDIRTPLFLTS